MKTGLKEAEGTVTANSLSSISISKGSNVSDQRGCFYHSVNKSLPELYTLKQNGCHEYCSLRYRVDTRDGSFDNTGDDEDSDIDRAIGDGDETIVELDPCSLQLKVQQVLQR